MALLTGVLGVVDSDGNRVDAKRDDGTYGPVYLKLGSSMTATSEANGGTSTITLDLNPDDAITTAGDGLEEDPAGTLNVVAENATITVVPSGGIMVNPDLEIDSLSVGPSGVIIDSSGLVSQVLDPVSAQDAATKHYVDTFSGDIAVSTYGTLVRQHAKTTTNNATPKTLMTYTMPVNAVGRFRFFVTATETLVDGGPAGGGDSAGYTVDLTAKTDGTTVTGVGSPVTTATEDAGCAALAVNVTSAGLGIIIQVTGIAARFFRWRAWLDGAVDQ